MVTQTFTPRTEEYWGNVNPVGPRGVYDEAKRFQEAMTMAYHTYQVWKPVLCGYLIPMAHGCA